MNVITNNQIVYDSGLEDGDYENAFGLRKSSRGREGGRASGRKRTGFNRAIGVIPIVAGARYLQRRRAERQDREKRQSQSLQSQPRMANPNRSEAGQYEGRQSEPRMANPNSGKSRPIPMGKPSTRPPRSIPTTTNPLQGKPDGIPTNEIPKPNNNKKIALIVGGILLLGVAAYFYKKRNK